MSATILDGGMGQELIARSGKATGLWSTQALIDAPELIRGVHDDFFAAGAEIATTDTYAVLPDRFETYDMVERLQEFTDLACQIACDARDAHGAGLVAGSMGPLGFSYQPDLAPPAEDAAEAYGQLAAYQLPYVDMHLLETMASVDQARGGLMGASVTGKPVWIALSVDDNDGTKLRSGEALSDALPLITEFQPEAVLINCSRPEAVSQAVPVIAGSAQLIGAYANGFTNIADSFNYIGATVDVLDTRKDLSPDSYADFAAEWIAKGANIVGGCCEVGPAHIAELSKRFAK